MSESTNTPARFELRDSPMGATMVSMDDGNFVHYEEYVAALSSLRAENDRLREALTNLLATRNAFAGQALLRAMDAGIEFKDSEARAEAVERARSALSTGEQP